MEQARGKDQNTELQAPHLTDLGAAEYLGVSPATLRAWRLQCRGPAYRKLGRAVRYHRQDLDAWSEAQVVQPLHERTVTA
jgi:excisionase family DNA binding protein